MESDTVERWDSDELLRYCQHLIDTPIPSLKTNRYQPSFASTSSVSSSVRPSLLRNIVVISELLVETACLEAFQLLCSGDKHDCSEINIDSEVLSVIPSRKFCWEKSRIPSIEVIDQSNSIEKYRLNYFSSLDEDSPPSFESGESSGTDLSNAEGGPRSPLKPREKSPFEICLPNKLWHSVHGDSLPAGEEVNFGSDSGNNSKAISESFTEKPLLSACCASQSTDKQALNDHFQSAANVAKRSSHQTIRNEDYSIELETKQGEKERRMPLSPLLGNLSGLSVGNEGDVSFSSVPSASLVSDVLPFVQPVQNIEKKSVTKSTKLIILRNNYPNEEVFPSERNVLVKNSSNERSEEPFHNAGLSHECPSINSDIHKLQCVDSGACESHLNIVISHSCGAMPGGKGRRNNRRKKRYFNNADVAEKTRGVGDQTNIAARCLPECGSPHTSESVPPLLLENVPPDVPENVPPSLPVTHPNYESTFYCQISDKTTNGNSSNDADLLALNQTCRVHSLGNSNASCDTYNKRISNLYHASPVLVIDTSVCSDVDYSSFASVLNSSETCDVSVHSNDDDKIKFICPQIVSYPPTNADSIINNMPSKLVRKQCQNAISVGTESDRGATSDDFLTDEGIISKENLNKCLVGHVCFLVDQYSCEIPLFVLCQANLSAIVDPQTFVWKLATSGGHWSLGSSEEGPLVVYVAHKMDHSTTDEKKINRSHCFSKLDGFVVESGANDNVKNLVPLFVSKLHGCSDNDVPSMHDITTSVTLRPKKRGSFDNRFSINRNSAACYLQMYRTHDDFSPDENKSFIKDIHGQRCIKLCGVFLQPNVSNCEHKELFNAKRHSFDSTFSFGSTTAVACHTESQPSICDKNEINSNQELDLLPKVTSVDSSQELSQFYDDSPSKYSNEKSTINCVSETCEDSLSRSSNDACIISSFDAPSETFNLHSTDVSSNGLLVGSANGTQTESLSPPLSISSSSLTNQENTTLEQEELLSSLSQRLTTHDAYSYQLSQDLPNEELSLSADLDSVASTPASYLTSACSVTQASPTASRMSVLPIVPSSFNEKWKADAISSSAKRSIFSQREARSLSKEPSSIQSKVSDFEKISQNLKLKQNHPLNRSTTDSNLLKKGVQNRRKEFNTGAFEVAKKQLTNPPVKQFQTKFPMDIICQGRLKEKKIKTAFQEELRTPDDTNASRRGSTSADACGKRGYPTARSKSISNHIEFGKTKSHCLVPTNDTAIEKDSERGKREIDFHKSEIVTKYDPCTKNLQKKLKLDPECGPNFGVSAVGSSVEHSDEVLRKSLRADNVASHAQGSVPTCSVDCGQVSDSSFPLAAGTNLPIVPTEEILIPIHSVHADARSVLLVSTASKSEIISSPEAEGILVPTMQTDSLLKENNATDPFSSSSQKSKVLLTSSFYSDVPAGSSDSNASSSTLTSVMHSELHVAETIISKAEIIDPVIQNESEKSNLTSDSSLHTECYTPSMVTVAPFQPISDIVSEASVSPIVISSIPEVIIAPSYSEATSPIVSMTLTAPEEETKSAVDNHGITFVSLFPSFKSERNSYSVSSSANLQVGGDEPTTENYFTGSRLPCERKSKSCDETSSNRDNVSVKAVRTGSKSFVYKVISYKELTLGEDNVSPSAFNEGVKPTFTSYKEFKPIVDDTVLLTSYKTAERKITLGEFDSAYNFGTNYMEINPTCPVIDNNVKLINYKEITPVFEDDFDEILNTNKHFQPISVNDDCSTNTSSENISPEIPVTDSEFPGVEDQRDVTLIKYKSILDENYASKFPEEIATKETVTYFNSELPTDVAINSAFQVNLKTANRNFENNNVTTVPKTEKDVRPHMEGAKIVYSLKQKPLNVIDTFVSQFVSSVFNFEELFPLIAQRRNEGRENSKPRTNINFFQTFLNVDRRDQMDSIIDAVWPVSQSEGVTPPISFIVEEVIEFSSDVSSSSGDEYEDPETTFDESFKSLEVDTLELPLSSPRGSFSSTGSVATVVDNTTPTPSSPMPFTVSSTPSTTPTGDGQNFFTNIITYLSRTPSPQSLQTASPTPQSDSISEQRLSPAIPSTSQAEESNESNSPIPPPRRTFVEEFQAYQAQDALLIGGEFKKEFLTVLDDGTRCDLPVSGLHIPAAPTPVDSVYSTTSPDEKDLLVSVGASSGSAFSWGSSQGPVARRDLLPLDEDEDRCPSWQALLAVNRPDSDDERTGYDSDEDFESMDAEMRRLEEKLKKFEAELGLGSAGDLPFEKTKTDSKAFSKPRLRQEDIDILRTFSLPDVYPPVDIRKTKHLSLMKKLDLDLYEDSECDSVRGSFRDSSVTGSSLLFMKPKRKLKEGERRCRSLDLLKLKGGKRGDPKRSSAELNFTINSEAADLQEEKDSDKLGVVEPTVSRQSSEEGRVPPLGTSRLVDVPKAVGTVLDVPKAVDTVLDVPGSDQRFQLTPEASELSLYSPAVSEIPVSSQPLVEVFSTPSDTNHSIDCAPHSHRTPECPHPFYEYSEQLYVGYLWHEESSGMTALDFDGLDDVDAKDYENSLMFIFEDDDLDVSFDYCSFTGFPGESDLSLYHSTDSKIKPSEQKSFDSAVKKPDSFVSAFKNSFKKAAKYLGPINFTKNIKEEPREYEESEKGDHVTGKYHVPTARIRAYSRSESEQRESSVCSSGEYYASPAVCVMTSSEDEQTRLEAPRTSLVEPILYHPITASKFREGRSSPVVASKMLPQDNWYDSSSDKDAIKEEELNKQPIISTPCGTVVTNFCKGHSPTIPLTQYSPASEGKIAFSYEKDLCFCDLSQPIHSNNDINNESSTFSKDSRSLTLAESCHKPTSLRQLKRKQQVRIDTQNAEDALEKVSGCTFCVGMAIPRRRPDQQQNNHDRQSSPHPKVLPERRTWPPRK